MHAGRFVMMRMRMEAKVRRQNEGCSRSLVSIVGPMLCWLLFRAFWMHSCWLALVLFEPTLVETSYEMFYEILIWPLVSYNYYCKLMTSYTSKMSTRFGHRHFMCSIVALQSLQWFIHGLVHDDVMCLNNDDVAVNVA